MTDTITWGFTHIVATRDGDTTTAKCGRTMTRPGGSYQSPKCPDCYGIAYPVVLAPLPLTTRRSK